MSGEDFEDVFSSVETLNEATKFNNLNIGHDFANAKNIYIVSFFNDIENNLSRSDVNYIFSKFGSVFEIHYVEHGRVFVAYKEKQDADKAMETMKMCGKKQFLDPQFDGEAQKLVSEAHEKTEALLKEHHKDLEKMTQAPSEKETLNYDNVESHIDPDIFGLYSLTFINKDKDLSERKVRLDFTKFGDVARIRGQFNNSGETIIVSFSDKESAEKAVQSPSLASEYGPSFNTCPFMDVVPDKDGHFSIEFINSGMSGIREITNEFSKHGEVMKVMAGGAKNAVKRVTVSFADRNAAFEAVKAHETSKDFVSIDFSRECLLTHPES